MIESYLVLAERIRKELDDLERLVARANRAVSTAKKNPQDADLFLDSASLNLHDIYSGFERIFKQIAATVDGTVPTGAEWHREILEQMGLDLPRVRPPILTREAIQSLDEYLRFRHVVRNVYTFSFDPERIGRLVKELDAVFEKLKQELSAFADFLETVSGK
jgi:ABC-type transporter Mla subunit MlaD